jgi:S-adenosylmethionine synthetase
LMPIPIMTAHKLVRRLTELRKEGELDYLRPDGKSQVTVEYHNGEVKRVHTVVISTQHNEEVSIDTLRQDVIENVIRPVIPEHLLDSKTIFHVNPTGRFVVGGPQGDCGLTGRKIIVDTYGGVGSHGGGCFSGKDCTKVDRSASYMARYIAKNIVGSGAADKVEVQLAYAIGVADPVSIMVDTFGTCMADEDAIKAAVWDIFPLTPKGIIEQLDLRRPIYKKTAAYGHFGRSEDSFSWERLDKAEELKSALKL